MSDFVRGEPAEAGGAEATAEDAVEALFLGQGGAVGGGGADIGPLRSLGTALAGFTPDSQRYFDVHHAESDVFEAVSPRELHLGAVVMAAMVYLVGTYGL